MLTNYVGLAILHAKPCRRAFGAFRPPLFAERTAVAVFTVSLIVARLSHLAFSGIALHIQYEHFAAVARGSNFAITCR